MRHDFHDYQRERRRRSLAERKRMSEADAWRALASWYATPAVLLLCGIALTVALLFFFG